MAEFSRVNRPIEEAGAFYTRLAPWYDLLASSEKRSIRRGLELSFPCLRMALAQLWISLQGWPFKPRKNWG
jgi:hypothetical protein